MLTFFATAKPFRDQSAILQRNALQSWKLLHPHVEVILFGDDPGAAEIARELGLRHEPFVERNEFGTKRLDFMFARAQEIARHDLLCYLNCDIILLPEFCGALQRVQAVHDRFLMVGRRWDMDIPEPIDFHGPRAADRLRELALQEGVRRGPDAVDYFAFPRGLYSEIPPLVVGRIWWDHYLVWKARDLGADVVDVSSQVTAIHQNHDYGYHPGGAQGVWTDPQARRNYELAGGKWHLYTIADSTHILESSGERCNWGRFLAPCWRVLRPKLIPVWFGFLHATRPMRKLFGLRRKYRQSAGHQSS
ncbi:MAG: hypothetical protein DMG35_21115 [Acidobacteria bacterium]|nr:MAG: hypothetical protein DMG35_21115 [Acidobacteriota bacterium]